MLPPIICSLLAVVFAQQGFQPLGIPADFQQQGFFHPPNNENNLQCGFTCTRQAQFTVNIDGAFTTATCTAKNANPSERCFGCCQARALAAGLLASSASGFPSTNGYDCVCCFNKNCRK